MKKKDINAILTTVALFVLFKTLLGGTENETDADMESGEKASDFEYDILNNRAIAHKEEDDEPETKDFVEWLQEALDNLGKVEQDIIQTEAPKAEAISDDTCFEGS